MTSIERIAQMDGISATIEFHSGMADKWLMAFNDPKTASRAEYCQQRCQWHKAEQFLLEIRLAELRK
jgi:hypothetical protein